MTRDEWDKIVAFLASTWPHSPPEEGTIEIAFTELADLPAEQVLTAVRTFNRDGERFPPTSGQIRSRMTALLVDYLDYGEAWSLAKRAALKADPRIAAAWLGAQSPEALAAVRDLMGGKSVLEYNVGDEATVRAQFRDIYRAACVRARREVEYQGLPSANLPALERGTGPRKLDPALLAGASQKQLTKGKDGGSNRTTDLGDDGDGADADAGGTEAEG